MVKTKGIKMDNRKGVNLGQFAVITYANAIFAIEADDFANLNYLRKNGELQSAFLYDAVSSEDAIAQYKNDLLSRDMEIPTLVLRDLELTAINEALKRTNFIQAHAARLLGITPRQLNHKISTYNIKHWAWRKNGEKIKA